MASPDLSNLFGNAAGGPAPMAVDPGSIALRDAVNALKAGQRPDESKIRGLSPAQQNLFTDYKAICDAAQSGSALSAAQMRDPAMRDWVAQQPGGKIQQFDATVGAFNAAFQQINEIAAKSPPPAPSSAPVGATPRALPQQLSTDNPITAPPTTPRFNRSAAYSDPFGPYKQTATEFYKDPKRMAGEIALGSQDRAGFRNTLQNAVYGDFNATRRAMNDINAGRAPSETPVRPEYRDFLGDYRTAMGWTKGDMSRPLSGNRFSAPVNKANELRQTAEREFPQAQAAVQNWSPDKTHSAPNGRTVADVGEMDFQTQSQRQILGAFKITTEYVLNAKPKAGDSVTDLRTQISDPYNEIMRGYVRDYAALGKNPGQSRVQALQDNYIDKARQQASQDLDARGRDIDKNAVARDLRTAGQQEVGRINQGIEAQVMRAFDEIPEAAPSSVPQYRQQQPGMHLTN